MSGPPVIVYLVLSHSRPAQLGRLVRTLLAEAPAGKVVIHHDPTGTPVAPGLAGVDGHLFVPRPRPVRWADFSEAQATFTSFDWLLRAIEFDWVVVLSGQDYPVRPLHELEQHLAATPFDGFVEGVEVPPPALAARVLGRGLDEFSSRYYYRYVNLGLPAVGRRWLRRAWSARLARELPSGELRLGLPRARVPFDAQRRCMRGSAWYTLSRRCVEVVARALHTDGRLVRHYRSTFSPAESLAHTVLYSEPDLRLSGDYMRFTSWSAPNASHPDTLTLGDLERITSSGAFFARKFDEAVDPHVLDALDGRRASAR